MSIQIIKERLNSYNCKTTAEEQQALREITQEVILAALGRSDFFEYALFQGGTCLRIFYGLQRFSEDMDFVLRSADSGFSIGTHIKGLADELKSYGFDIQIVDKNKSDVIVKKAFIKDDSIGKIIELSYPQLKGRLPTIKIKLEVDTNPPAGSGAELKYLDFPFLSSVSVQDKPSLFASKIHALLCRKYLKGRDWYDFLWYTSNNVGVNYELLSSALNQLGPWENRNIEVNAKWLKNELGKKIKSIDWEAAKLDVSAFLRANEQASLKYWNTDLFLSRLEKNSFVI